jgi:peptidoglycan hydrolase-like protein with peptidoglycan-binding domain
VPTTTTPPDRLAGVNWIQATYASPCTDTTVRLVGGSALQGGNRAVLDDVVAIDSTTGSALAFLSCRGPGRTTTQTTVAVVRARSTNLVETLAERELGAAARVVDVQAPRLTVEFPATAPPPGACCADVINRLTLTATPEGFTVTSQRQLAAFEQTVAIVPAVGADAELVRRSVTPATLCYQWDNVWLGATAETEPAQLTEPSAELQTIRLALIHVTGRWIEPTDHMNAEMAAVVTAYQESRGLAVDGAVGPQMTNALQSDLGCPDRGGFTMVPPTSLGPRNFQSVAELIAATDEFTASGKSGNASIDQLLTEARWDGRNSMFLGCYRWESPAAGMSCSWSGPTPLQLVGLVADPATPGLGGFSILYARSTAV